MDQRTSRRNFDWSEITRSGPYCLEALVLHPFALFGGELLELEPSNFRGLVGAAHQNGIAASSAAVGL